MLERSTTGTANLVVKISSKRTVPALAKRFSPVFTQFAERNTLRRVGAANIALPSRLRIVLFNAAVKGLQQAVIVVAHVLQSRDFAVMGWCETIVLINERLI